MDEILTINEVAAMLKCSPTTLYRWRKEGTGPKYFNLRGDVRYKLSEINAFIDQQTTEQSAKESNDGFRPIGE
jgi:excisionase family DNA binding protein